MTKKRFKFSLAALGLMLAFLLALMALLLAPTLASADKNSGNGHNNTHHDSGPAHGGGGVNPIYFQTGNGSDGNHDTASGGSLDFCAFGNHVCTGGDDKPGTQTFGGDAYTGSGGESDGDAGHSPNGSGGDQQGGQGNGFHSGFFGGGNGGGNGGSSGEPGHDGTGQDGNGHDGNGHDGDGPGDSGDGPHIPDLQIDLPGDDTPLTPDLDKSPSTDTPPPGDGPTVQSLVVPEQIPEPLTLSLFAAGLAGTAALRRRRKGRVTFQFLRTMRFY
jgi:PEP-CTERM motif